MPTALPMTSGQKEAVKQGTKEARAIIDNNIVSLKQNVTRFSNLIDLVMEKYQTMEAGFLDLENTNEMQRRENEMLKAENERLRLELARKR